MAIETLWSKERILEVYLNSAEFGPGIYGIEAASQAYFHKPASKLSANEAARLAAVLPSPRKWKVLAPGPYVASRAAWIQRQMGYGGRAAPAEDFEPLPPPGELPEEEAGSDFDGPVFVPDPPAEDHGSNSFSSAPEPGEAEPATPTAAPTADTGPSSQPFVEEAPIEAPQPVEPP